MVTNAGYDITLDGTKYRLVRTVEGTRPYRKSWRRQFLQQQLLGGGHEQSRADERSFFQTDWSQGSRWELPRYSDEQNGIYEISTNFDPVERPGYLIPSNKNSAATDTNLLSTTPLIYYNKKVLAIGSTTAVDATNRDVFKWTPGSDAFVQESYHSGYSGSAVWGAIGDPRNDRVFFLGGATMNVYAFDPETPANGSSILATGLTGRPGSNIFLHNDRLLVWDANKLYEVEDPLGTPALSAAIANDGLGPDLLNQLDTASSNQILKEHGIRSAIPTPDGIFYFKNVLTDGQPQPWIFRIDRDAAGTDISTPITTLPAGNMAVSLGFLLGALVISTTPDWAVLLENDAANEGHVRADFYHYTSFNGLNGMGRPLDAGADESPLQILGSEGDQLYIGGQKRIWVYHAARGGIHPVYADAGPADNGVWRQMARTFNSSGEGIKLFLGATRDLMQIKDKNYADPDTVTNFGDDLTFYTFESAYFDFNLPVETKQITEVELETDTLTANQKYYVYISVDDGAWGLIASHTSTDVGTTYITSTTYAGRKFRYKIVYETKDATNAKVRAITFKANTGEMVPVWDLILSGDEIVNVENEVIDPESVYDALETTAQKYQSVTFIDNFRSKEADDTTTHDVKIMNLEFFKQWSGESEIHLTLIGVADEAGA